MPSDGRRRKNGIEQGYRKEFHAGSDKDGRVLGPDRFIEHVVNPKDVKGEAIPLETVIKQVTAVYGLTVSELEATGRRCDCSEARAVIAYLATQHGSTALTEVAHRFGRDISTLSTALRRLSWKVQGDTLSECARQALEIIDIKR